MKSIPRVKRKMKGKEARGKEAKGKEAKEREAKDKEAKGNKTNTKDRSQPESENTNFMSQ